MAWPDSRLLDLLGVEQPIVQAPMAGASTAELAIEVRELRAARRELQHGREIPECFIQDLSESYKGNYIIFMHHSIRARW